MYNGSAASRALLVLLLNITKAASSRGLFAIHLLRHWTNAVMSTTTLPSRLAGHRCGDLQRHAGAWRQPSIRIRDVRFLEHGRSCSSDVMRPVSEWDGTCLRILVFGSKKECLAHLHIHLRDGETLGNGRLCCRPSLPSRLMQIRPETLNPLGEMCIFVMCLSSRMG